MKLWKKLVEYSVHEISLGKFPAEVCDKCGEQFFDEETAQHIENIEKEKGLFARRFKRTGQFLRN